LGRFVPRCCWPLGAGRLLYGARHFDWIGLQPAPAAHSLLAALVAGGAISISRFLAMLARFQCHAPLTLRRALTPPLLLYKAT
jgi:hypothetical protein